MTHLDLFSGIGGFALAAQTVWGSDYRCVGFCEIDPFCQQTLRKNFPGVRIYGDIRGLTAERLAADTAGQRLERGTRGESGWGQASDGIGGDIRRRAVRHPGIRIDLLTGGFPCQPFSTAGKRKGTEDDRFLWPEMFRIVRETKPRWVLGENVAGILNMALGQVCSELESLDYEVQCFVIPACAVNAPHRRDRVWIVAHATDSIGGGRREGGECRGVAGIRGGRQNNSMPTSESSRRPSADTESARLPRREPEGDIRTGRCNPEYAFPDWSRDWREVAFESCVRGVDDGLPRRMARLPDGSTISESRLRQNSLKAYGNAIVPQVAMEIMRGIKAVDAEEAVDSLATAA